MKFIYVYLIGIVLGLFIWYINKKNHEYKEKIHAYDENDEKDNNGYNAPLPNACAPRTPTYTVDVCMSPKFSRAYKTNKIGLFFIVFILTIVIVMLDKYNLLQKIKPIIINIVNILKPIFIFLLGLCTPYLTDRTTKKLNKMRKKRKKKKNKSKKHKKKKNKS